MARTQITGDQVLDGYIFREDLNTTITGKAVIRKIIEGQLASISSTGTDSGTGDVTLNIKWTINVISGNYSANKGDHVILDGTSVITITFPASPSAGDMIKVTDISGDMTTNNAVISRNGKNIMGLAENFSIDKNYITCIFTYVNTAIGWAIEF